MTNPFGNEQLGFFDYPEQEEPTYDPPHDGPCFGCGQPLTHPMKTISLAPTVELPRSYFYRAHAICYEADPTGLDEKAMRIIERGQA